MNILIPKCRLWVILVLWFFVLEASSESAFPQRRSQAQILQADGIAKIDSWLDYVRSTGDATSKAAQLSEAQSALYASRDLFLKDQNLGGAALSTTKIGDIERVRKQFRDAATTYQKAIEFAHRANRADYETLALAHMALSEVLMEMTEDAKEHARRAVNLGENCGNKMFYFEALDQAGQIEVKLGNLPAAADLFDRALTMRAEVDKKKLYYGYGDRAEVYYNRALKCLSDGNEDCGPYMDAARADYERGLAITNELGYHFVSQGYETLLEQLTNLSNLYSAPTKRPDPKKADEQLDTSGGIQHLSPSDEQELKELISHTSQETLLAVIEGLEPTKRPNPTEADMFNPKKAGDVLVTESFAGGESPANVAVAERMMKEQRDWRARMQRQGLVVLDQKPENFFLEGQLAEWKGNNDEALAAFRRAVELLEQDRRNLRAEGERGAFLEDRINYYYKPALLLLDRKQYGEAFALFEWARSRAISDMLASRPPKLGTAKERTLFSHLQALRVEIAALQEKLFNLTGSNDRDQHATEIVNLENQISAQQKQYEEVEAEIGRETPKLAKLTSSQQVNLATVQQSAREGGFDVLYYAVIPPDLILWHINGSGVQVKKVFLPDDQLTKKLTRLRQLLLDRQYDSKAVFDETTSRELFLFLIQPVLSWVTTDHLVIIPHEQLNSLPFQVLQSPETEKFLGESFAISYAPSATVLATLENRSSLRSSHLLAVADPAIPDAPEEVQAIGKFYQGHSKLVTQAPATKADLQAWVSGYNLVHLSVHGKFNEADPLLSYLQFKPDLRDQGRLTAAEMFGLPLQKGTMVVLSACETGRVGATHTNEVLGMVRSLLYAGAGDLVLSSWQVDAASTKLWMQTFYREGQNNPPAEAARRALVAVKSHPEYSHPFYWAPFLMTGK